MAPRVGASSMSEKSPDPADVTLLLQAVIDGREGSSDELLEAVYHELRALAASRMRREQPGQTLQATALVHEAWLRLLGGACRGARGRLGQGQRRAWRQGARSPNGGRGIGGTIATWSPSTPSAARPSRGPVPDPQRGGAPSGSAVSEQVDSIPSIVDATDVVIVGDLDGEQVAMIEWALDRFAQTDLTLPAVIRVTFDPSRAQCRSELGVCRPRQDPPEVVVCEPDGQYAMQQMNQRITLLHELAHLWYRAALDGPDAPDFPTIVGSPPNRRCQNPWLRTATGSAPFAA